MSTYSESAQGITITQERALAELVSHNLIGDWAQEEFFADMGKHDTYEASEVLAWLGY